MTMVSSVTDAQSAQTDAPPGVPLATDGDVESPGASTPRIEASWVSDIEHVHVQDDPRTWSPKLKVSRFFRLYDIPPWSRHVLITPSADGDFVPSALVCNRRVYSVWPSLCRWSQASVAVYLIVRNLLHIDQRSLLYRI
jgi:hypothetical protein